ncbi:uncharacterized protein [Nicotiana sylvestris]|uniref:Uncharacterized protein LOC104231745 isoform X2 n=1 Tax=Nicotiana sylvestris TaxID=4096 RepID=A0A1U7WWX4_NICSY|nr:PREDICTED: uncharacterized protein LOC104231745 isoform X2 [Nicotiana sylvestris]
MHLLEVLQPFLFHQKVPKILFSLSNKRKLQKFSAKLSIDNFKSIKFDVNINVKKNSNEDRFDYLQVRYLSMFAASFGILVCNHIACTGFRLWLLLLLMVPVFSGFS